MTFSERNIKSTEVFPADYPILHEDDFIRLLYGANDEYYQITNRQRIVQRIVTDETNWLLASGKEKNAGDISDWLEPSTGGYKVLYILAFGVFSDRNVQVQISNPGSGSPIFGTKTQGKAYVTPSISSIEEPTVTVMSLDNTYSPQFVIKNPSEYTLKSCAFGVKGFKYRLDERIKVGEKDDNGQTIPKPKNFSTINMNSLMEA